MPRCGHPRCKRVAEIEGIEFRCVGDPKPAPRSDRQWLGPVGCALGLAGGALMLAEAWRGWRR